MTAVVPEMHEFPSKSWRNDHEAGHRSSAEKPVGRGRRDVAVESTKSFAAREFPMTSFDSVQSVRVEPGGFSTRQGPFSTQAAAHIQLRDLSFVTRASTVSYLTTGVESRSSVPYAPTNQRWSVPSCADRRTVTSRSSSVSRLS